MSEKNNDMDKTVQNNDEGGDTKQEIITSKKDNDCACPNAMLSAALFTSIFSPVKPYLKNGFIAFDIYSLRSSRAFDNLFDELILCLTNIFTSL